MIIGSDCFIGHGVMFINDTFDQCITTNKYYIIFPVCPDINNVENREDWTIEKWIQHGLNDIYTFGTYSIVIFLFTKFKDEYESITNNVLYEKGTFSRHLLNILDIPGNFDSYIFKELEFSISLFGVKDHFN